MTDGICTSLSLPRRRTRRSDKKISAAGADGRPSHGTNWARENERAIVIEAIIGGRGSASRSGPERHCDGLGKSSQAQLR